MPKALFSVVPTCQRTLLCALVKFNFSLSLSCCRCRNTCGCPYTGGRCSCRPGHSACQSACVSSFPHPGSPGMGNSLPFVPCLYLYSRKGCLLLYSDWQTRQYDCNPSLAFLERWNQLAGSNLPQKTHRFSASLASNNLLSLIIQLFKSVSTPQTSRVVCMAPCIWGGQRGICFAAALVFSPSLLQAHDSCQIRN